MALEGNEEDFIDVASNGGPQIPFKEMNLTAGLRLSINECCGL